MIKFKIFTGSIYEPADYLANRWSEEHPDVELLDFKYQHVVDGDYALTSICIAYKEFP